MVNNSPINIATLIWGKRSGFENYFILCLNSIFVFAVRTSPDTSKLRILNGIIIGKKKYYVPGDNVTVHCYAGYSLRGPSAIRYIGGKKWLPEIPSCTLSM